jgi:hypothetical protein
LKFIIISWHRTLHFHFARGSPQFVTASDWGTPRWKEREKAERRTGEVLPLHGFAEGSLVKPVR